MKSQILNLLVMFILMITMSGCEIIGTIFQGGVVIGIIIALVVIGILGWIFSKMRK